MILRQQKHPKSSACITDCGPDVAREGVQEEMLRTIMMSVGLQPQYINQCHSYSVWQYTH